MNKSGTPHERIEVAIELLGLAGLVGDSLTLQTKDCCLPLQRDDALKKNSFHLPIKELTSHWMTG